MNTFDEQLQQIDDTAEAAENALKLKKLYTWYDIENAKEEASKNVVEKSYTVYKNTNADMAFMLVLGLALGGMIIVAILH